MRCVSIGEIWNSILLLAINAFVCDIFTRISYIVYKMHKRKTKTASHSIFVDLLDDHLRNLKFSRVGFEPKNTFGVEVIINVIFFLKIDG